MDKISAEENNFEIKAYKRRWIVLGMYMYYSCLVGIQWIEYSSITQLVVKYYNVSSLAVDWSSTIFPLIYPFLIVPATYIIDKKGLRTAGLIGCLGQTLATVVKVFSIRQDLFWVVLLGQAIASSSQLLIITLPTKVAAVWFKANEVSTACSLGIFGSMLGNAIGFMLPPMIVKDHADPIEIGHDLQILCWILAIAGVPVSIAIIFYFPKQPPLPPSAGQVEIRKQEKLEASEGSNHFLTIRDLFLNKSYVIHLIAFGINVGVFSGIYTLLSQFVVAYFKGANEEAGQMGFCMFILGMIASVLCGVYLDKTHQYKECSVFLFFSSALAVVALMFSLNFHSKMLTFIACILVGITSTPYSIAGFELTMELTFPCKEGTTTGILIAMTQIFGTLFTVALGYINIWLGPFWALASQVVLLLIGTLIETFVPNLHLRQDAFRKHKNRAEYALAPTEEINRNSK